MQCEKEVRGTILASFSKDVLESIIVPTMSIDKQRSVARIVKYSHSLHDNAMKLMRQTISEVEKELEAASATAYR